MSTTFLAACSANSNVSSMCWNADGNDSSVYLMGFVICMVAILVAAGACVDLYEWATKRIKARKEAKQ